MRIGIDFDDTLVDTSESYNRLVKKKKLKLEKNYHEYLREWKNKTKGNDFDPFLYDVLTSVKLIKGVKKVINTLIKEGHELFIITARRNHLNYMIEDMTRKFIYDNKLNISNIYFNQDKKSDTAKKLNIDLMIDDNKYIYDNMKEENIDCILFKQDVKTWEEVLEYIRKKGV